VMLTTHYMDEAQRLCDRVAIVDHGRIIALGTPTQLIAQLGGEHMIDFCLSEGSSAFGDAELTGLPSVRSVRQNAGACSLAVDQPHVALPGLLSLVQSRGISLAQLTTRHATLEDVFVSLTGRHLEEGESQPS
jgi:ABC-2 type transport system ATP-binding protein